MTKQRAKIIIPDPKRSSIMRAVKDKNTGPELSVRKMVFAMGHRYRLHRADLPGKPDLVFPAQHKIIFVHGCFWHGHSCARGARIPKNNRGYWINKITRNKERDQLTYEHLTSLGWKSIKIWECELRNPQKIRQRLTRFLKTHN